MVVIPHAHSTIARARELRRGGNAAEGAMWNVLKARRLGGHKFVRQHPVGPYFADFVHRSQKLMIEIDGSQHVGSEKDRRRNGFMLAQGYSVLRFWSADVLRQRETVCETILAVLEGRMVETVAMDVVYLRASGPSPSRAMRDPPLPLAGEDGFNVFPRPLAGEVSSRQR